MSVMVGLGLTEVDTSTWMQIGGYGAPLWEAVLNSHPHIISHCGRPVSPRGGRGGDLGIYSNILCRGRLDLVSLYPEPTDACMRATVRACTCASNV